MMTLTIQHEDRPPIVYENVVAIDFFDKENCEHMVGRELSKEELEKIEHAVSGCEYFPTEIELLQIIEELEV